MVALPNPSFEPKTHRWRPGAGAQFREVPSQDCEFCAPKKHFLAQNGLETHSKRPNEGKCLLHVRLDCPVTNSPFLPSNSTICPRNAPKIVENGLNVPCFYQTAPKPRMGCIFGYVAQNQNPRAPSPPATPHFLSFPSLRFAQRDNLDPHRSGHLLKPEGSLGRARWGPTVGSHKATNSVSKSLLDALVRSTMAQGHG